MDDIPGSVDSKEKSDKVKRDITTVLNDKGFKIKQWQSTGDNNQNQRTEVQRAVQMLLNKGEEDSLGKVLGMEWDTANDVLRSSAIRINVNKRETTKRAWLSPTYSLFDPLGILSPIIVIAKILLRKMSAIKLQCDTELPPNLQGEWDTFKKNLQRA